MAFDDFNFVDNQGMAMLRQIVDGLLNGKVDKAPGYGLSENNLTNELLEKILNAGSGTFTGNFNDLLNIPTIDGVQIKGALTKALLGLAAVADIPTSLSQLVNDAGFQDSTEVGQAVTTAISTHNTNTQTHQDIRDDIAELSTKIDGLENLGQHVGTFDTFAAIPTNTSGFAHITANDFVNVRADETQNGKSTRYIVAAIDTSGTITWTFDIAFSADISGKMDLQSDAAEDNFAIFESGQVVDSGISRADFGGKLSKSQGVENAGLFLRVGDDGMVTMQVIRPMTNAEIFDIWR